MRRGNNRTAVHAWSAVVRAVVGRGVFCARNWTFAGKTSARAGDRDNSRKNGP
jgi:hypothetical protein